MTMRAGADGSRGWPEAAPFVRIIVTAAARRVPPKLRDQLGPDGIMVIPVGESTWDQKLLRITRDGDSFREEELLDVRFVPLVEDDGGPAPGTKADAAQQVSPPEAGTIRLPPCRATF